MAPTADSDSNSYAGLRRRQRALEGMIVGYKAKISDCERELAECLEMLQHVPRVYQVLTLPNEITSEIFVHCLPRPQDEYLTPSPLHAPMLLLHICSTRHLPFCHPLGEADSVHRFWSIYRGMCGCSAISTLSSQMVRAGCTSKFPPSCDSEDNPCQPKIMPLHGRRAYIFPVPHIHCPRGLEYFLGRYGRQPSTPVCILISIIFAQIVGTRCSFGVALRHGCPYRARLPCSFGQVPGRILPPLRPYQKSPIPSAAAGAEHHGLSTICEHDPGQCVGFEVCCTAGWCCQAATFQTVLGIYDIKRTSS
ncbi:hypothetical protein B0H12DRAFT_196271 [Mycena haematopus]|nr:hypothetical protein B0H12DRAFT_196271 [Mycena haematopus]